MSDAHARLQAWLDGSADIAPITALLGVQPQTIGEGTAVVSMAAGSAFHNPFGMVHGGLLCALADVAMGVALATTLGAGEGFTTLSQQMNHVRAVRDEQLLATATVVHRGRQASHVEARIEDEAGRLVATASCACQMLTVPA